MHHDASMPQDREVLARDMLALTTHACTCAWHVHVHVHGHVNVPLPVPVPVPAHMHMHVHAVPAHVMQMFMCACVGVGGPAGARPPYWLQMCTYMPASARAPHWICVHTRLRVLVHLAEQRLLVRVVLRLCQLSAGRHLPPVLEQQLDQVELVIVEQHHQLVLAVTLLRLRGHACAWARYVCMAWAWRGHGEGMPKVWDHVPHGKSTPSSGICDLFTPPLHRQAKGP